MKTTKPGKPAGLYQLSDDGRLVIQDYNRRTPFSNFFPGVAGVWGIPMWVFYVNRGQAISSFGIESKDKAMLEFVPANKAYRMTALQGFRTFLKLTSGGKTLYWEPFQTHPGAGGYRTRQTMSLTASDLTIEDENLTLGVTVTVNYFTMPGEAYPALVRRVTVRNTGRKTWSAEMVDGLPMILPYGMKDWLIKNMSRTVEAWVKVRNLEAKAPFYQLNVEVSDTPDVRHITEGNFYFSFDPADKTGQLLDPIVEAAQVFGPALGFLHPERFAAQDKFSISPRQETSNRTPSAMCAHRFSLKPSASRDVVSLVGHAQDQKALTAIVKQVLRPGFLDSKAQENRDLVAGIGAYAFTHSASRAFDLYSRQTFIDNVLRGGLPVSLATGKGTAVFNVFSRKHGDLERDYNYFTLSPTYFSQGNGNYRDVNQNRRNDVWFNTDVRESSVVDFLNLIQADGYNPLIVKGMSFHAMDPAAVPAVVAAGIKGDPAPFIEMITHGFQPGELLRAVRAKGASLKVKPQVFLEQVLGICRKQNIADHGEGFWSDHWTYNLDLIESYLSVYPEGLGPLLLQNKTFTFYHNNHYLLPRDSRYLLTARGVRQYHAVKDGTKEIKIKDHLLRTRDGEGDVYHTTLLAKLICLAANKAATLDPSGIGIEMEGDRPNWYDALNGLPGLLGSSLSEALELQRLCQFLLQAFDRLALPDEDAVVLFRELAGFVKTLSAVLEKEQVPAAYWHQANDAKEHYRAAVRHGIDGAETAVAISEIRAFLRRISARITSGVQQVRDKQGLLPTYFYHEVVDYALLDKTSGEEPFVLPVAFRRRTLPLFLEGFVHALRAEPDQERARTMARAVRASDLFDRKLRMYKVNADLTGQSEEIGRTRIFPRGWLENESIWLHMEYKYLLELLRCGLYPEFFEMFKDVLIPFQDAERYGRSILENSSFIASSAHEDEALHGQGFVARLSGSTAEFLHLWLWMNAGQRPFRFDPAEGLTLALQPVLPGWLFAEAASSAACPDAKGQVSMVSLPAATYAFRFLGSTLVVYHNPERKDTFGEGGAKIYRLELTYPGRRTPVVLEGGVIPSPHAQAVRENKVSRIDAYLS